MVCPGNREEKEESRVSEGWCQSGGTSETGGEVWRSLEGGEGSVAP